MNDKLAFATGFIARRAAFFHLFGEKCGLDRDQIEPGTLWPNAIRRAISKGDFFIACFSEEYSERSRTYMNEELTVAIEELRQRSPDSPWFIPVRLSGEVPDREIGAGKTLRDLQWVDLTQDWEEGIKALVRVVSSPNTVADVGATSTKKQPEPSMHLASYLEALKCHHGWLDMIDLRRSLRLPEAYVTLRIALQGDTRQVEIDPREAVKDGSLVILGDPGAGKTTMLRHLAYCYADRTSATGLVPILASVADLSSRFGCDLRQWLQYWFPEHSDMLEAKLLGGEGLVLLDGLDEAKREVWRTVRAEVDRLTSWGNHIVVSARSAAYPAGFLPNTFRIYQVLGFDRTQQMRFVSRFFSQSSEKRVGFFKGMRSGGFMETLGKNPLLLALTATLYDNAVLCFPAKRTGLYAAAIDFLISRWREVRCPADVQPFDEDDKKAMLSWLAFQCMNNEEEVLDKRELLRRLRAWQEASGRLAGQRSALLRELTTRDGILVPHGTDRFRFLHLTFQEYFAADHLVRNPEDMSDLVSQLTSGRLHRWREVFLLVAERTEDAAELVELMASETRKWSRIPRLRDLLRWAESIVSPLEDRWPRSAVRALAVSHAVCLAQVRAEHQGLGDVAGALQHATNRALGLAAALDDGLGEAIEATRSIGLTGMDLLLFVIRSGDHEPNGLAKIGLENTVRAFRKLDQLAVLKAELTSIIAELERLGARRSISEDDCLRILDIWSDSLRLSPELSAWSTRDAAALLNYLTAIELTVLCKTEAGTVSSETWQLVANQILCPDAE